MKAAVIGAGGNLGSRITKKALDSGMEVTAIIRKNPCSDERAVIMQKSLFDLTREDISGFDVIFSAFGGGFTADPKVNREAINHLSNLVRGTSVHLITIGGAGSLYTDASKTKLCYEEAGHPDFLRPISENLFLGLQDLKAETDVNWTFVCPSLMLDGDSEGCGDYMVGTEQVVIRNADGASYVTYHDLACAMVDFGVHSLYNKKVVTVASTHGSKSR